MPTASDVQAVVLKVLNHLNEKSSEGGGSTVVTQTETVESSMTFALPTFLSLIVYADGLLLSEGADYTVSGQSVTLSETWPAGTVVSFEMVTKGSRVVHEVTVETASTTFELPNPPTSLSVFVDGVLANFGDTYTFSEQTVTFTDTVPVGTVLTFVINL